MLSSGLLGHLAVSPCFVRVGRAGPSVRALAFGHAREWFHDPLVFFRGGFH